MGAETSWYPTIKPAFSGWGSLFKIAGRTIQGTGYPYAFYTMEEIGHEVSEYPMKEFLPEIEHFIRNFVL